MKRLLALTLLLACLISSADAANRFWVPLTVTGAISGTGGLCRLTVNSTTNLTAGNAVIVAGILGATACDGTTTVTTVVDATHVEVNLVFNLAYTSGGTVAGGNWTATGTGNWSTTTGGAGGSSVPGSADVAIFDGSSGGSTVTLNFGGTISLSAISTGAFTGTWDNSVNNNNMTLSIAGAAWNNSGSGVRTIKLGTATYTLTSSTAQWFTSNNTNLTFQGSSANVVFSGSSSGQRQFNHPGSANYGTLSLATSTAGGSYLFLGGPIFGTFTVTSPNFIMISSGGSITVTNPLTLAGTTQTSNITLMSSDPNSPTTVQFPVATTLDWMAINTINFTVNAATATNSLNLGGNTNITFTAGGGGGACILGGWLLWRDFDPTRLHNDNFPAWLDKAA